MFFCDSTHCWACAALSIRSLQCNGSDLSLHNKIIVGDTFKEYKFICGNPRLSHLK